MPGTRRRRVIVSTRVRTRGRPRLFAFGYPDLAELFGVSEVAVRQMVRRGFFDPKSLSSIVAYANRRAAKRP